MLHMFIYILRRCMDHYLGYCGRHAVKQRHCAFSMIVLMDLSAHPFCWCWWGTDCCINMPNLLRVSTRSELINHPPWSIHHFWIVAPYWMQAIASNYFTAFATSDFFLRLVIHIWPMGRLIINKDNKVLVSVVGFYQKRFKIWMVLSSKEVACMYINLYSLL